MSRYTATTLDSQDSRFCSCGGDVRAYHRAIEELHHMRGLAGLRQELQERLNTPERLSRQNRFQTLFQLPNRPASARQVMLCTVK